ncbi:ceramide glucosyltransferase [Sugiyamaella lignohabitans]|uniref:Ceramide glucosyltransferase n=1 Tax=Sugiyamaella lignohabitans TaxID=796027 RepID=A0A167E4U6_9ASCO|nr:ceramide glucosyltransferase [Sugiyamaella lignohabitans]ANB13640.1 ceramide glucosyltransferase [Sugiyamaella lignohabitans]
MALVFFKRLALVAALSTITFPVLAGVLAHDNDPSSKTYENIQNMIRNVSSSSIQENNHIWIVRVFAILCFVWYGVIVLLSSLGLIVVRKKYTQISPVVTREAVTGSEGVTILRPLKGIDTEMEACLTSAFSQDYPKFEIIFCIASESDPAVQVAQRLIGQFPYVDAKILIGEGHYGPNPKINNLAQGYEQAKYDIIWVLDSNVWVAPGTLARSVDAFYKAPNIQLVHHLPMCMSIVSAWDNNWGSKLDEMFMLTAHSKFYSAINAVAIAPCVMGKSNLYRRSDLDRASGKQKGHGIRVFAQYIAEDNMIADALWKAGGRTALTGDSVVQPLANVDFEGYVSRRIRWLRVRRYMVLAATLLEPTTECFLCGIFGSFAISVLWLSNETASYFSWIFFITHLSIWCASDYWHFHNLIQYSNMEHTNSPFFVSPYYSPEYSTTKTRPFLTSWLPIWILREVLALPIWVIAMCGHKILWRNKPFRIKSDLTAEEIL